VFFFQRAINTDLPVIHYSRFDAMLFVWTMSVEGSRNQSEWVAGFLLNRRPESSGKHTLLGKLYLEFISHP
jgi:hypothetical protein